jgi:hypothetical protein
MLRRNTIGPEQLSPVLETVDDHEQLSAASSYAHLTADQLAPSAERLRALFIPGARSRAASVRI